MELNEYQEQAMTTCMESSDNLAYMLFNLIGEVGELTSKILWLSNVDHDTDAEYLLRSFYNTASWFGSQAKKIRKHPDWVKVQALHQQLNKEYIYKNSNYANITSLVKEAGDILWQLAGLCSVMDWNLEDIAQQNLDKLASRQERGKIDGDGDNR